MAEFLNQFAHFLDNRFWRVGIIIGAAILLALILRVFFLPILNRLSGKTSSNIDDQLLALINPAILRTVILGGIHWALIDFVTNVQFYYFINGTVITLLVFMWGRVVLRAGGIFFRRTSTQSDKMAWVQPQTLPLVQFAFKIIVFGTLIYLIMAAWKFNLTSWLASAGVVGIAVGFAAKDTLANFISGIFILIDSPYQVGQYINIDDQTRGMVTDIGMRSTRLLTRDNVEITVPNAVIGNSMVVNETSGPSTRMRTRVLVSVAYGSDVDEVRELLLECAEGVPHTCSDTPPSVRFTAMADSGLNFEVRTLVVEPEFRGRVIDTLNTRIYKKLNEAGISIPFPQQDVHISSWPGHPNSDAGED